MTTEVHSDHASRFAMRSRRSYSAPVDSERCRADIKHGKVAEEGARCMRRKVNGSDYCSLHQQNIVWVCQCNLTFETEREACQCKECGPRKAYTCVTCGEFKFNQEAALRCCKGQL